MPDQQGNKKGLFPFKQPLLLDEVVSFRIPARMEKFTCRISAGDGFTPLNVALPY